jgi:hypothetical protein
MAMSKTVTRITLPGANAGTQRSIVVHRYGTAGARPKVYIQASLHADEVPGAIAAHHLIRRLDEADRKGEIRGEIIVVPMANPIGLDQFVAEKPMGRFDLGGAGNFNRHYPELTAAVAERVSDRLGPDPDANVALIRAALKDALAEVVPANEADHLRKTLLSLSIDSDIVLDLHCDDQALVHVYMGTPLWPNARDLTADLKAEAVLLAEISGGEPFDEANSSPWWRLTEYVGTAHPIPPACLAATVELRGQADVDDETAAADADNLFRFLQRRGIVAGDPGPLPEARCEATPLAGVDMVKAPVSGIVAYRVKLGDRVRKGDLIAEIIDWCAEDHARARTPVYAGTDGPVWSLKAHRYVQAGMVIAKISGATPIEGKGKFLLTAR